jgi:hypothetical protein
VSSEPGPVREANGVRAPANQRHRRGARVAEIDGELRVIAYQVLSGCVLNFAASATPTFDCRTEFEERMDCIRNRAVPLQDKALSRVEHRPCVPDEPSESTQ